MDAKHNKGGRPTNYRAEACRVAERGGTQPEIAAELRVTNRTLSRWALRYAEFRSALDRGLVRRSAKQRWAETAPLREAALELRRMIANAIEGSGSSTSNAAGHGSSNCDRAHSLSRACREPSAAWNAPAEVEPYPSYGEPIELLDPRSNR